MNLKRLLEFVLPAAWQQRRGAGDLDARAEGNDAALARLQDGDAVYRALMDHAHEQFEQAIQAALHSKLEAHERAYHCGMARGLALYITSIEAYAVRAREELQRRSAQREARERVKT